MKSHRLYFLVISFIVPISISIAWAADVPRKADSVKNYSSKLPQKTVRPVIKIDRGYCCTDGDIVVTDEKQCRDRKGQYFADENKAKRECKGACCVNGFIKEMNAKSCQAKRGTYYGSVKKAQQKCTGFCCKSGMISKTTQQTCTQRNGTYYQDERSAKQQCQGYCCSEFEVSESTEQQCTSEKGSFFSNKHEADKYCKNQKGYCCIDGKTTSLIQERCKAKKGIFYPTRNMAEAKCKENRGYCNTNGKTLWLTEAECKKKKGTFFKSQTLAKKSLLSTRRIQSKEVVKPGDTAIGEKKLPKIGHALAPVAATTFQLAKPDLLPTRIWVDNKTCRLWVEWKNQGSTAPEKSFTERYSLSGQFHHGSQSMTNYSFDSGQKYPISAPYRLNHPVTDQYPIKIDGPTQVTFTIDGTNVHPETNESNNEMTVSVNCLSVKTHLVTDSAMERVTKLSPENQKAVSVAPSHAFKKTPENIPLPPEPEDREFRDSGHPDLVITLSIELPEQDGSWSTNPTATINVTNIGDQATSAETTVDLSLSDHPNLYYGRTLIPFWSKMVPILVPNMTHSISHTFHINETSTMPGTQTSHTILPGTFRLVSHLNTELLAPGEEAGDGANDDEVIFEHGGPTGFYDLAMLGAKLTDDNRLKLHLKNLGANISPQKHSQMDVAVSIDGGAFKSLTLTTIDPQGGLRAGPLDSPSPLPKYIFTWPLPTEAGGNGLAPFVSGARHQITARVGQHAYNNNVHFGNDSHPGNNERVNYVGGTPDLVVCFKKTNLSKTARNSYYPPRVKNIGNAPSGPANLRFWIEDKGAVNYTVPSLPAGGEHSIQRRIWWVLKGIRRFTLMVDNNTEVGEGPGELNNIIAGNICVSATGWNTFDDQGCVNSETLCSDAPGMADQ